MVVYILEKVPASLRGELTRWLLEPKTGVFVGRISAEVRDRLWEKIRSSRSQKGAAFMIHRSNNAQGFLLYSNGKTSRELVDYDGMTLVRKPPKRQKPLET